MLDKHIGACRFVYNLALEVKQYAYKTQRVRLSRIDLINQLPGLKEECSWLKEIDSQALQQAIINMDNAYNQFFKGHASYPKFKKHSSHQSFRNPHGKKVKIVGNKIVLPKFRDGIRFVQDRQICGTIKSNTISKTPTGKYFISILAETGVKIPEKKPILEGTSIGIDMGLSHFIITSDGIKIAPPKYLKRSMAKLKYLGRQLSSKKKGSKNRQRAKYLVALAHEKITNQRKDFLHKLSTQIVKNHDTLCFEDLHISGMIQNHKLAQSIADSSWGIFMGFCNYKCEWQGKNYLEMPRFEASTKPCNKCGAINNTLTLADREWVCANCGVFHDRDVNAAINIKKYSLTNCGGQHRGKRGELLALAGAVNRENLLVGLRP